MVNDTPIKGIQCRLRDALNIINNIKLSDVSSIEEAWKQQNSMLDSFPNV